MSSIAIKRTSSKRRKTKTDEEIIRDTMKNKDMLLRYLDMTDWIFQDNIIQDGSLLNLRVIE